MNVLEKIFEKIEEARETYSKNRDMRFVVGADKMANKVKEIIVSHMDDCKIFEFDFTSVKSFDCQCGRHYVNTCNDDWIPVEDRLPSEFDEDDDGIITVETTSVLENGERATFIDDYDLNTKEFLTPYKVVAWRKRPEPYKPKKQD